MGGVDFYNKKTNTVEKVKGMTSTEKNVISVFSIMIDDDDKVWVTTLDGLYTKENGEFKRVLNEYFGDIFIRHISKDSKGNIWLCTNFRGIYKIDSDFNVTNFNKSNTPELKSNRIL